MIRKSALSALAALSLSACVAGPAPEIATPPPALPEAFLYQPAGDEAASLAALLPQSDPAFATLSRLALADAPTLAEALARVEAARAGANRAGAERLPNIGADTSVTASRSNPAQFGADLPAGINFDTEQTAYAANLRASWEVDLFGRIKANERAALARLDAASETAQAVRTTLLAEVAAGVIDWRTLDAREETLKQDLESANESAALVGERVDAGLMAGFDRLRAESVASQTETRLAALQSERARLIGRLIALTAQDASEITAAFAEGNGELQPQPAPAALPSTLLVNRPDLRASAAQLMAADADLAAAARARFPRLTLSGALGLLAFDLGELFDSNSDVGSIGGSLVAPLLDFGRIQSEIDRAAADKRAAFAAYRGAVFTALGEAETAYGLVAASNLEAEAALNEAAKLGRVASLADTRFNAGLEDSLALYEARRAADASGDRAAAALGRAQRARVLLWQALGGSELTPQPGQSASNSL